MALEFLAIAFEAVVGVVAVAVVNMIVRRRYRRLNAAVRFTEADFVHSEFSYSKFRVGAALVFGAVSATGTGWVFIMADMNLLEGLTILVMGGGITAIMVVGAYNSVRYRAVFDNWTLTYYRDKKALWKLHMSELERTTSHYVQGTVYYLVLTTHAGQSHKLAHRTFQNSHKLWMMLSDPQRAFEDAVPIQP